MIIVIGAFTTDAQTRTSRSLPSIPLVRTVSSPTNFLPNLPHALLVTLKFGDTLSNRIKGLSGFIATIATILVVITVRTRILSNVPLLLLSWCRRIFSMIQFLGRTQNLHVPCLVCWRLHHCSFWNLADLIQPMEKHVTLTRSCGDKCHS